MLLPFGYSRFKLDFPIRSRQKHSNKVLIIQIHIGVISFKKNLLDDPFQKIRE
jgi:hypothetical protein